jgi:hypothetical protein
MFYNNYANLTNEDAIRKAHAKLCGYGLLAAIQRQFSEGPLQYTADDYTSFILRHRLWYLPLSPTATQHELT